MLVGISIFGVCAVKNCCQVIVYLQESIVRILKYESMRLKHDPFQKYTMRTDLLNSCHLVSISKNVVFYAFLVVRIY